MKKMFSLFLLFLLTTIFAPFIISAINGENKLVVYYYRYDGNYEGFNFHLWDKAPNDSAGKDFHFNNADVDPIYGAYHEINLNDPNFNLTQTTKFGIIVKKGGWDGYREPGGDRFIDKDNMEIINGMYRIFLVEGDLNIGSSKEDLDNNIPDYRPKILRADFTSSDIISTRYSHIPNKVELLESGNVIQTLTPDSKNLTIRINSSVDLLKAYLIKAYFDDNSSEKLVSITGLYDSKAFTEAFTYDGELGAIYNKDKTIFRLWAPISENVTLNLYKQGHPNYNNKGEKNDDLIPFDSFEMKRIENGAFEYTVLGNLENTYYTFSVTNYGETHEVTDPYSFSTGANGLRSMVTNFANLNPLGWEYKERPNNVTNLTDYIVYELHVRDLTTHSSWNGSETNRGKFLGFTETGTTYTNKESITVTTGIDHLEELGINAVQLLPIFDFGYVDEVKLATDPNYTNTFNWGYMPYHFNTLEGSYSTNPFDGSVRINEFKQLVQSLHNKDIRVIMDVVYNHTGESENSNFHKILPNFYHRMTSEGGFSNGSGTGNETASERLMVRKFMKDSLKFLATEYNLSGFRFDLMALHDVETMQEIEDMLYEIDPTIIVYGEPWHAGGAAIDFKDESGKNNIINFKNIGAFNDTTRDAIKGQGDGPNKGWLQNDRPQAHYENIKYGIVGGIKHQDVKTTAWHGAPQRTINYVTAHDNYTLHDKLRTTGIRGDALEKMVIQANAIILTSQGIPFLHAGVDFMRSKPKNDGGFDNNSYESPDAVNQLRWDRKAQYLNVFEYYKTLIHLRKNNPQFKMTEVDQINAFLRFVDYSNKNIIGFEINIPNLPRVVVAHNASRDVITVNLPSELTYNIHTFFDEHNPLGLQQAQNSIAVFPNRTLIAIEEVMAKASVKDNVIAIDKGSSFDIYSNVNIPEGSKVSSNSFFNLNSSGKYNIAITVNESNGKISILEYILYVKGKGSGIDIIGGK